MLKLSLGWFIFLTFEAVAVACWFAWGYFSSSQFGMAMWATQFVLLMPGNITAAPAVEHLLWNRSISLNAIGLAELVASLVVNALVWLLLLGIIRRVRGRYAL